MWKESKIELVGQDHVKVTITDGHEEREAVLSRPDYLDWGCYLYEVERQTKAELPNIVYVDDFDAPDEHELRAREQLGKLSQAN